MGKTLRLDAWAMKRSYTKPCIYGYEIKVSRADFLGDTKMQHYAPLCNVLYVVAAHGVCDKSEVPEYAGLLEVLKNGGRLFTRKKAQHRDIDFPEKLVRYVLYSRTKITAPKWGNQYDPEEWLVAKEYNRNLGANIRGKIGHLVEDKINKVESEMEKVRSENLALKRDIDRLNDVKELLEEMGIPNLSAYNKRLSESRIRSVIDGVSGNLKDSLIRTKAAISELESALDNHNKKK